MALLDDDRINKTTGQVIESAIAVHKHFGPGLLESVYEACLAVELMHRSHKVVTGQRIALTYKNVRLDAAFTMDMIVDDQVVVEVKAVEAFAPVHRHQLLTYLKLAGYPVGLLINFNVPLLKDGVKRVVNADSNCVPA